MGKSHPHGGGGGGAGVLQTRSTVTVAPANAPASRAPPSSSISSSSSSSSSCSSPPPSGTSSTANTSSGSSLKMNGTSGVQRSKKSSTKADPAELRVMLLQMLLIVLSVGRVTVQAFAVYLWHVEKPVTSFLGFTTIMAARPLIMAVTRTALEQIRAHHRLTLGAAVRLLLLLPVAFWLLQCFNDLWWTYDWRVLMLCLLPAFLHAAGNHVGPSKEAVRRTWNQAGPPHYKPSAMTDVLKHIARVESLRILEVTWYFALLPFFLIPEDHAVMSWFECAVLGLCGGLDLIAVECTHPYCNSWERLYGCACILGRWQPCRTTGGHTWAAGQVWARGDIVRHRKKVYKAVDHKNTAEPSNRLSRIFWSAFRHPARAMARISMLQLGIIVVEFLGLLFASHWFMVSVWGGSILLSYLSLAHTLHLRRTMLRECARLSSSGSRRGGG